MFRTVKQIETFKVIKAGTIKELVSKVNADIRVGWKPIGQFVYSPTMGTILQSMVRY